MVFLGVIGDGLGRTEQVDQVGRPGLPEGFIQPDQFAQMMGIAQTVKAIVVAIRGQAVMDRHTNKVRQDGEVLHGDQSSPGMMSVPRQMIRRSGMQPIESAFYFYFVRFPNWLMQRRSRVVFDTQNLLLFVGVDVGWQSSGQVLCR